MKGCSFSILILTFVCQYFQPVSSYVHYPANFKQHFYATEESVRNEKRGVEPAIWRRFGRSGVRPIGKNSQESVPKWHSIGFGLGGLGKRSSNEFGGVFGQKRGHNDQLEGAWRSGAFGKRFYNPELEKLAKANDIIILEAGKRGPRKPLRSGKRMGRKPLRVGKRADRKPLRVGKREANNGFSGLSWLIPTRYWTEKKNSAEFM